MCAQQPLGTIHVFHLLLKPIFSNIGFLPEDRNSFYSAPCKYTLKFGKLTEKIKIIAIKFLSAISKNRKSRNKGTAQQ